MQLAVALHSAMGLTRDIEIIEMPPELREKYQYFTQARMNRLRDVGYTRPFTTLEDGIHDYVSRYLARDEDPYR
jgi:ADP-L-glycero-D-manno-heptose 6-epimerase